MKKRFFKFSTLIVAILALVLCFAACGGDTTNPPASSDGGTSSSVGTESKDDTVKVTFDTQGATYTEGALEATVKKGATLSVTQIPYLEKSDANFVGWAYDRAGMAMYVDGDTFSTDTTLYAIWFTGSVPGGSTTDSSDPTDESNPTDSSDPTDSSKPGSSTGSSDNDDEGKLTVKFDVSRTQNGIKVPDQKVKEGGKVAKPDFEPFRKGAIFYGWCVNDDKSKVWDFENDVVTGDMTLFAVFEKAGSSTDDCEHNLELIEYVAPTCQTNGRRVERCTLCRKTIRTNKDNDPTLAKLEHLELLETTEPTCANDGFTVIYCPNGCGLSLTTPIPATGKHEYDMLGWVSVVKPTTYVSGREERPCKHCGGAVQAREKKYTANASKLYADNVDISFLYTGGEYENVSLVNVATLGKILVSSYFDGTKGSYANDGNTTTFWNADTYNDGASYAADWLELTLAKAYDIGAIKFTLPNYYAWELGEDCYVSFDIEYWDEEKAEWAYLTTISDKESSAVGISCEVLLTLDSPINTSKIRANVTHASRYAPAVIYEIETYAKTEETDRIPVSNVTQASVSISGKYNEWVAGADALKDNTTATSWTTDARYNPVPWALYEFATEQYIACIQISVASNRGRTILVESYQDGEWKTIGSYAVPGEGETGGAVISNVGGICIFNIDVEQKASKLKFTVTREPQYWTSIFYDIIPYTISEVPYGEPAGTGCSHANPKAGNVIAPSCGVPGYTEMNCVCGAVIRTKATDALSHDWGRYTVETEATATALGTKVSKCRHEGCDATNTINYEKNYDSIEIMDYLHGAPAAWAQTFDDGNYLDTYTWANEYYIKYGVRATLMMAITYSDALVDIWQDHFTKGVFDLGSHSYNHTTIYAGQVGVSSMVAEVINAQYWFRHNFKNQQLITFAAPLGATSNSVASYLAGVLAANRNGGDTGIFYNTPDQLISREVWGDLNSYISKADQTEGDYVFVNVKKPNGAYVQKKGDQEAVAYLGDLAYALDESYKKMNINLVFNFDTMKFEDVGYSKGTYVYSAADYRYDYVENGSYKLDGGQFVFTEDGSGEYKLVKATLGSYEKGVETLVSVGGFTVECLHSLGSGSIYSSYASTISKLEHLTRFGVWAPSYNELIQYLKEAKNAVVELVERTDSSIKISVTDSLDDYMYDQALTIKIDIPNSWTSVVATQGGVNIPLVSIDEYRHTKNMSNVSCAIDDGYLYVDVIPDAGEIVISVGEKDDSVADYENKVVVGFDPGEGTLASDEYETRVVVTGVIDSFPTPTRYGYIFKGWYRDAEFTSKAVEGETRFVADTTLYALWEEMPKCVDGTYVHKWSSWMPSTDDPNGEVRKCKKCPATETRLVGDVVLPEEKCVHTGVKACELCGEYYDTILSDWLIENGVYNADEMKFSISTTEEAEEIIEYIEIVYDIELDASGLIYNAVAGDNEYTMYVYFDNLKDSQISWSLEFNGATMSGVVSVDTFGGSINVLAFDEFDGDAELESDYATLAAEALKRTLIVANSLMIEGCEAPFGMKEMGFVNLNYAIKCDHEGVRVCTLCGASFKELLIEFVKENGAIDSVSNSYFIEAQTSDGGVTKYVQIIYHSNAESLSLTYGVLAEDESLPSYGFAIYLDNVDNGTVSWALLMDGKTMTGNVAPNGISSITGSLDYDDFAGESSEADLYAETSADAFKGAVSFADAVLTDEYSYACPFGMYELGFELLIVK